MAARAPAARRLSSTVLVLALVAGLLAGYFALGAHRTPEASVRTEETSQPHR